jgi:hypothetical protein
VDGIATTQASTPVAASIAMMLELVDATSLPPTMAALPTPVESVLVQTAPPAAAARRRAPPASTTIGSLIVPPLASTNASVPTGALQATLPSPVRTARSSPPIRSYRRLPATATISPCAADVATTFHCSVPAGSNLSVRTPVCAS